MTSLDEPKQDGARRIVVALDGSASSIRALRHGARIAEALRLEVTVVTVWHQTDLHGGYLGGPLDPDADATTAVIRAMQAKAVAVVFGASPPAGLERSVLEGATIPTLLTVSDGAEMLVLGSRGHGGFAGLLLGSVSAACAAHATCAVLVCHSDVAAGRKRSVTDSNSGSTIPRRSRDHSTSASREIVVGVDGTRASLGALRQGAAFAESLHLPLHAICVSGGLITSSSNATAVLKRASQQVFGAVPPRWFRSSVRDGTPAAALGQASEHARMLVIGHSGSGTPTASRESVSSAIALEALCPVVIFHATHVRDPAAFDGSIV